MENKKPQKASLSHSSLQSCRDSFHHKTHTSQRRTLSPEGQVLTDRHVDNLNVILDQMMKMTDAETQFIGVRRIKKNNNLQMWQTISIAVVTNDGEEECVCEVSVERKLHHVPPQPQQLHCLGQAHKDVIKQSRKDNNRRFRSNRDLMQKWYITHTKTLCTHFSTLTFRFIKGEMAVEISTLWLVLCISSALEPLVTLLMPGNC